MEEQGERERDTGSSNIDGGWGEKASETGNRRREAGKGSKEQGEGWKRILLLCRGKAFSGGELEAEHDGAMECFARGHTRYWILEA